MRCSLCRFLRPLYRALHNSKSGAAKQLVGAAGSWLLHDSLGLHWRLAVHRTVHTPHHPLTICTSGATSHCRLRHLWSLEMYRHPNLAYPPSPTRRRTTRSRGTSRGTTPLLLRWWLLT